MTTARSSIPRVVRAQQQHGRRRGARPANALKSRPYPRHLHRHVTRTMRVRVSPRKNVRLAASAGAGAGGDDDTDDADREAPLPPKGFGSIEERLRDEGVAEDRTEVPDSVKEVYRKIEDPAWLERELLRADDGYPTSRAAVMRQAASTGDIKGFSYAVSSINVAATMLTLAYVTAAAARVGAEEGDLLQVVGGSWKWFLLLGTLSAVTEVQKFVESVVGVEGRRKM